MRAAAMILVLMALGATASGCRDEFSLPAAFPRPVAPTPALPAPPASVMKTGETPGLCGESNLLVYRFQQHFNASDGNHYHAWYLLDEDVVYVVC